jgi:hypothetical protein
MKKLVGKSSFTGGIAAFFLFLETSLVKAQTLCDPLGGNGCAPGTETFSSVATAVASFLFWDVAMPLSVIMVLVGAFKFMTSAGDPEKVSEARKTILYAAVGFAIACLCGAITNIIKSFVTGS